MTSTNISSFSSTVHKSNVWIRDLMEEIHWDSHTKTYHGLCAVLHTLRDRLTIAESSDFAAQLPMLLRGMYYEGWKPNQVPVRDRTKAQFLKHVFDAFPNDLSVDAEALVKAVFIVLGKHVSAGELADVKAVLPDSLLELWPASTE